MGPAHQQVPDARARPAQPPQSARLGHGPGRPLGSEPRDRVLHDVGRQPGETSEHHRQLPIVDHVVPLFPLVPGVFAASDRSERSGIGSITDRVGSCSSGEAAGRRGPGGCSTGDPARPLVRPRLRVPVVPVAAVLVVVAALAVRILYLGSQSYWNDEIFSVNQARQDLSGVFAVGATEVHTPLYALLLHVWIAWGSSTVTLWTHALSAVFGLLAVGASWTALRRTGVTSRAAGSPWQSPRPRGSDRVLPGDACVRARPAGRDGSHRGHRRGGGRPPRPSAPALALVGALGAAGGHRAPARGRARRDLRGRRRGDRPRGPASLAGAGRCGRRRAGAGAAARLGGAARAEPAGVRRRHPLDRRPRPRGRRPAGDLGVRVGGPHDDHRRLRLGVLVRDRRRRGSAGRRPAAPVPARGPSHPARVRPAGGDGGAPSDVPRRRRPRRSCWAWCCSS